jgi:hypothetical protein
MRPHHDGILEKAVLAPARLALQSRPRNARVIRETDPGGSVERCRPR